MDFPARAASRFFRQFYVHSTYCEARCHTSSNLHIRSSTRSAGTYSKNRTDQRKGGLAWKKRTDILPEERLAEYKQYDMVTAVDLQRKNRRPKRTKMLMRDFIEDSLYNPSYGYFSKEAVIFNPGEPFHFGELKDEADFQQELGKRYTTFEDELDLKEYNDTRQLWHTPTELFRPHYAEAMARYLISNYKLSSYPYHDLIIYEMGAGNGTFMVNVLDYIRDMDSEVYARTKYRIIEISTQLASLQMNRLAMPAADSHGHADKVEIINKSIFSWDTYVSSPCFFLALEVIDNFAHDVIRYSPATEQALQGTVLIDSEGEFYEFYSPQLDPVAARFLRVRDAACNFQFTHPLRWSRMMRGIRATLPLAPNLSEPEWIPTRLMQFFDTLQKYFPAHKLLLSDFHTLPDAVKGINAPVVQTRYQRQTVPVSTPLVCYRSDNRG
jgi:hypothetical protein